MSDLPVPLPPGAAPASAPAWLSHDALRWADPRLPRWAEPRWPALALLLTVIAAILLEPEQPCTVAAPCGPDWLGMIQMGLAVVQLPWYFRLPELTLVSGPVLAVLVAVEEFPLPGTAEAANAAVIAALAFGWAASWQRLALRRRQRHLAEQAAAGVRHPLPEDIGPLRRGLVPVAAGFVLCAVAGVAVGLGLRGVHEDEQRAAKAESVSAVVIGHGEDTLRVRASDGSKRTVDAAYPDDYDTDSAVILLSDGDWSRLAAEPYDAFGWQLLTLAAGLPGLTLLAVGVLARRRAAALRRAPVPVLRVLQRVDHNVDTWIYAADDTAGRTPLLRCLAYPVIDDEAGEDSPADDEDEDWPDVDTRLREAVLYGPPYDVGELVIVTADWDGNRAVLLTSGPVRLPKGDQGPELERPVEDVVEQRDPKLVERAAVSMRPVARPVRWGPGVFTRCSAVLGAVFVAAVIKFALDEVRAGTLGWHVLPLLGLAFAPGGLADFLNWRVTADRSGLWLAGAYKVRHLTWEELRAVAYTGGVLEIRRVDGKTWAPSLGWPWMERRLRVRPSYVRAVEEISAMHAHPELRPTEESQPRDRGLPLGPVLAVLYVLWAVALLIL
ncbi:hypothetical protein AB0I51_05800 [Streptomyces sp. NPDC050549]|uniref:hypothetical protein n=1 Tax=Streptomyces sp. NPDC050549 TaxID=3155406 RepID=UPI003440CABB